MYCIEPSNMAADDFISERQTLDLVFILRSVAKACHYVHICTRIRKDFIVQRHTWKNAKVLLTNRDSLNIKTDF